MTALPLLDVVLASDRPPNRSVAVADRLISASLSELQEIKQLDESLSPETPAQFDRQTAALVRGMYEDWARQTEALLDRVRTLEAHTGPLVRAEELRDAHGHVRAMLSVSLDAIEESLR